MKAKIGFIGLAWLLALSLYAGAFSGDRTFAAVVGISAAIALSAWVATLPLLRCPGCGRTTAYFDNYTRFVWRVMGERRRYVICSRCFCRIDRLHRRVAGQVSESSWQARQRAAWGQLAVLAALVLGFGSIVLGGIAVLAVTSGRGNAGRAAVVIAGCAAAFVVGLLLAACGVWYSRRR